LQRDTYPAEQHVRCDPGANVEATAQRGDSRTAAEPPIGPSLPRIVDCARSADDAPRPQLPAAAGPYIVVLSFTQPPERARAIAARRWTSVRVL